VSQFFFSKSFINDVKNTILKRVGDKRKRMRIFFLKKKSLLHHLKSILEKIL
jgi:hypothetical protein